MYDAIVIGARCAGSPTAMLLAQRGYRVLLVDRAAFPSEMPMSTHLIWPQGVLRLQRWGVLDAVRACCPPIATYDIDLGAVRLVGSPTPVEGVVDAYSPRRLVLDQVLVEAAVKAGAELREGFTVEELLIDDGRVAGIRGHGANGSVVSERAAIVVGADGPASLVARIVRAPEYNQRAPIQGTCWSYWSGVSISGFQAYPREGRCGYGWETADGLALVGVNWPVKEFGRLGSDVDEAFFNRLEMVAPELAERLRLGQREERWYRGSVTNFFRRPYGPGWALVGDAGYTKDPFTAEGISDSFHQAELLAAAIDGGLSGHRPLDELLADYERLRNDSSLPFYDFTCQMAVMEPMPAELLEIFVALEGNQAETERFLGILAMTVSPADFFAPDKVARILAEAKTKAS